MTQLSISVLHSTKQLSQLHKQIMDLHSHFKHSSDNYKTKIKYRMKQSINKINCMGQQAEQPQRKQQLQQAFFRDQIKHDELEKAFRQFFIQEYLSKTLSNKVLANDVFVRKQIEDRKLSAYPYSGLRTGRDEKKNQRQMTKQEQKQLQILNNQTVENSRSEVRYQLQRQKHLNYTLAKEVQLLQKELDNLNAYCQSISQNKPSCEQSLYQQSQTRQSPHDYLSQQQQQETLSDQQLSCQTQCLQRLIKTKSQLISQISQSNHLLRLKTSELNSRQVYLNKKRLLLQSNTLPKLQRQLNQILDVIKKNLTKQQEVNHLTKQDRYKSSPQKSRQFKKQLMSTAHELADINQLINSTLAQEFMRQKRHSVQNHLY